LTFRHANGDLQVSCSLLRMIRIWKSGFFPCVNKRRNLSSRMFHAAAPRSQRKKEITCCPGAFGKEWSQRCVGPLGKKASSVLAPLACLARELQRLGSSGLLD
jgi:hypothetical protein